MPAFVGGLLVILVGFIVADFVSTAITRSRTAGETRYTGVFATGVRLFLYFTAITIGLATMGIEVGLLYIFARATAWGLAAMLAIGGGLAIGLGGRDYVAAHAEDWMGRLSTGTPDFADAEPAVESGSETRRPGPTSTDD